MLLTVADVALSIAAPTFRTISTAPAAVTRLLAPMLTLALLGSVMAPVLPRAAAACVMLVGSLLTGLVISVIVAAPPVQSVVTLLVIPLAVTLLAAEEAR